MNSNFIGLAKLFVVGAVTLVLAGCNLQVNVDTTPIIDSGYPTQGIDVTQPVDEPTPEPTHYATPTAAFAEALNMGGYVLITLEPVGDIPAGTRVRAGAMWFDGINTVYQIVTQDGLTAEAREYQLALAPNVTLGPTPTAQFADYIGMGFLLMTAEQVGNIPAGTRVRISHASQGDSGWIYFIVAQDEATTAEAREDQLALAPYATPGPSPTAPQ